MLPEKQSLTQEYVARLNASPFFIVVNYKGLKVAHLTELRKRLNKAGAEVHIVKNSVLQLAAKEAGVRDFNGALTGQLAIVLGRYLPMGPDFIMQNLAGISQAYGRVGLFSILLLLWSSSGVFLPLEKALNRAWEVEKGRSWWGRHLLALEMALTIGFLILLSSAVVGVNVYVHDWLRRGGHSFPSPWVAFAYHFLIIGVMFGLTLAMFILLFKRLPNRPLSFRHVLPSALLTAIFWEAARSLFTLLLPVFNYRHVYGSIGVVVALMTWAYVSSAVTLFGAQVSRALYRTLRINGPIVEGVPIAPAAQSAGEVA